MEGGYVKKRKRFFRVGVLRNGFNPVNPVLGGGRIGPRIYLRASPSNKKKVSMPVIEGA